MTTIAQVTTLVPNIVPFQPESSLDSLLDILERHASSDDPLSIQLSERGTVIFNVGLRALDDDPLQNMEVRNQLFLLRTEVGNAPLHPLARELQAWLETFPPECTALVDPFAVMQHLLSEQTGLRAHYQRRLQTIFNAFTENMSQAQEEAEQQSTQLVQETAARIEEQNVLHAQDLTNLQNDHRVKMNLTDIRLNDANARIDLVQTQLNQSQQTCAHLQGRLNQMQPEYDRMRRELSQRYVICEPSKGFCIVM